MPNIAWPHLYPESKQSCILRSKKYNAGYQRLGGGKEWEVFDQRV